MPNTNAQTIHQMGNVINSVVRQATGRDAVENIDMDFVTVAQKIRENNFSDLFRQVEYLESSGTQYIYTDIPCKSGIECNAKVSWLEGGAADSTIFGGRRASSHRLVAIHQYPSRKWTLGYNAPNISLGDIVYNRIYEVEAKLLVGQQSLKVDDTTLYTGTDSTEIVNDFNMAIFASTYDSASNIRLYATARVYSLTVSLDEQIVADYIPCIRIADEKPGLYDIVSDTFYTNSGTGEFIIPQ